MKLADKGLPAACYYDFDIKNESMGLIYNKFAIELGLRLPKNFKILCSAFRSSMRIALWCFKT